MEWKSFVFLNFFWKRNFLFSVHYFTLIETQPTFKTAELLRTNLDWIRLPRDIVKEIMKGYKLEETIWKERKKEKDWGKKWGLLQYGGKQTKILLFPSLRPNAKRKREEWEQGIPTSDPHRLPSILIFFNNFFGKGIRWIWMKRLFYFLKIIFIKIFISFWCSFF